VVVSVEAPAAAPVDATCQQYLDALRAELGSGLVDSVIQKHDLTIRVELSSWLAAIAAAKKVGTSYFCFLAGLDWMNSDLQNTRYENVWGSVEEETPAEVDAAEVAEVAPIAAPVEAGLVTGLAGGTSRFQVFVRLYSTTTRRGIVIKADLDETSPTVPTMTKLFAGADWHERETWEMYGFWFEGHPHLVHLYLPMGFEGYPMRKDFPLLAREVKPWPGLTNVEPIAGEADEEAAE
jgi:NADH-quinone oxidoreductase subunit C